MGFFAYYVFIFIFLLYFSEKLSLVLTSNLAFFFSNYVTLSFFPSSSNKGGDDWRRSG